MDPNSTIPVIDASTRHEHGQIKARRSRHAVTAGDCTGRAASTAGTVHDSTPDQCGTTPVQANRMPCRRTVAAPVAYMLTPCHACTSTWHMLWCSNIVYPNEGRQTACPRMPAAHSPRQKFNPCMTAPSPGKHFVPERILGNSCLNTGLPNRRTPNNQLPHAAASNACLAPITSNRTPGVSRHTVNLATVVRQKQRHLLESQLYRSYNTVPNAQPPTPHTALQHTEKRPYPMQTPVHLITHTLPISPFPNTFGSALPRQLLPPLHISTLPSATCQPGTSVQAS